MENEFIIRNKPLIKIVLNKTEFEIINHQYKDESGVFSYSKLYDIEYQERSTDYVSTGIAFICSFLLPGPTSGLMKFRERIRMNYDGKEKKIILIDFNKQHVIKAIIEIKKQMHSKYIKM